MFSVAGVADDAQAQKQRDISIVLAKSEFHS